MMADAVMILVMRCVQIPSMSFVPFVPFVPFVSFVVLRDLFDAFADLRRLRL